MRNENQKISERIQSFFKKYHGVDISLSEDISLSKDSSLAQSKLLSKKTAQILVKYEQKIMAILFVSSQRNLNSQDIKKISDTAEVLLGYSLFATSKRTQLDHIYNEICRNEDPNVLLFKKVF